MCSKLVFLLLYLGPPRSWRIFPLTSLLLVSGVWIRDVTIFHQEPHNRCKKICWFPDTVMLLHGSHLLTGVLYFCVLILLCMFSHWSCRERSLKSENSKGSRHSLVTSLFYMHVLCGSDVSQAVSDWGRDGPRIYRPTSHLCWPLFFLCQGNCFSVMIPRIEAAHFFALFDSRLLGRVWTSKSAWTSCFRFFTSCSLLNLLWALVLWNWFCKIH